jgi:L-fuculokinase
MSHTAIFDIGKTNKKFLLFDEALEEVHRETIRIAESADEDGFPCEDLPALRRWMRETFAAAWADRRRPVTRLNVSAYGASWVHLDAAGEPTTPLYNYLKPAPALDEFYARWGGRERFALDTASPALGMLNSGLQLYWLKRERPAHFARIRRSLHFPQYAAYLFSGQAVSEHTSIGCHTALWYFTRGDYHPWVAEEGLTMLFPPLAPATRVFSVNWKGRALEVGAGIHDSSAALLPYLRRDAGPFMVLSTGTWSIALNPFSQDKLRPDELAADCMFYLRPDGLPVKASRLFLGREHEEQLAALARHFAAEAGDYGLPRFDAELYARLRADKRRYFAWRHLKAPYAAAPPGLDMADWRALPTFAHAYHQLIAELVDAQIHSIRLARGATPAKTLHVDGGFAANPVFMGALGAALDGEMTPMASAMTQGTALGAAMAVKYGARLFEVDR